MAGKRESEFVRLVYEGMTKRDAYRKAFSCPDMSDAAASKAASRLSKKVEFAEKVSSLDKQVQAEAEHRAVMNRVERMELLTQIVKDSMNGSLSETGLPDTKTAIRAIAELNKMEGAYQPPKVESGDSELKGFMSELMRKAQSEPLVRT